MMTARDYADVAAALSNELTRGGTATRWAVESLANDLADRFADRNPRFDRDRFLRVALTDQGPLLRKLEKENR